MPKPDVKPLMANIYKIYDRKVATIYALCEEYAARALQRFLSAQDINVFWVNRTFTAEREMFAEAFREVGDKAVGWYMAHGAAYGVYLELANNRKYAAIKPIVEYFYPSFMADLKRVMGAAA